MVFFSIVFSVTLYEIFIVQKKANYLFLLAWVGCIFLTLYALTAKMILSENGLKTYSLFSFLNEDIAWEEIHELHIEWPLEQLVFYSKRWKKDRIIGINAFEKGLKQDIIDELNKRNSKQMDS